MKRVMLVFVLGVFLVSLVAGADVAYVLRNPKRADVGFVEAFEGVGLSVELIRDKDVKGMDFSNYDLIFIGDTRLRNVEYLPADVGMVIANKYYGKQLGLVEKGGISKMAANRPLKIKKNGDIVDAYTTAKSKRRRINIPYYFIPDKYRKEDSQTVAKTFVGYKKELGDVIAYFSGGVNKCFFGITKTEFWTEESKELFKDCVGFVVGGSGGTDEPGNYSDGNETRIHDVGIVGYTDSVDGIRIKDINTSEYLMDENSQLYCGKKYKVDFKTVNNGDFIEDVLISGSVGNFNWSSTKTDLESGKSTTTGSKTIEIDFSPGNYVVEISAMIDDDANLVDNVRMREVEVVCSV